MDHDTAFVAPEGVYSCTEDHKSIPSNQPSLYPTRISTVTVRFPPTRQSSTPLAQLLGANNLLGAKDLLVGGGNTLLGGAGGASAQNPARSRDEEEDDRDTDDAGDESTGGLVSGPGAAGGALDAPGIFAAPAQNARGKRNKDARPKNNIRTTSSTFITRLQSAEGLAKILSGKQGDATFLLYNCAKHFLWVEVGGKSKEPLTRITFSAHPTCHDVNLTTASYERLDVIIGFSTGDLVWFDPISNRYGRLNKSGTITSSQITAVRWVPSSPTLFLASHADGTIIVYDKEREDSIFQVPVPSVTSLTSSPNPSLSSRYSGASASANASSSLAPLGEWNPLSSIWVTAPPVHVGGRGDKDKALKNPVSHWRVSRRSIVDFVFSPEVKYVAVIAEDGCLRVIDASIEQLLDSYSSYFGSLTCVAWSPDGRFILTGGQDDLLTIFSPFEQRVIARCQAHSSFVSSVAFDPIRCDTSGRTYRFGSVGEDCKLVLWDFSSGALHRPKLQTGHPPRISMSSTISLAYRRGSISHLPMPASSPGAGDGSPAGAGNGTGNGNGMGVSRYHPAPSRNEVSVVQPVLIKQLEPDLPSTLAFLPRGILTATKNGHVKIWVRPLALRERPRERAGTRVVGIPDVDLVV